MKDFSKSPTGVFVIVILLIIIYIILAQLNNYKSVTPGVWLQTSGTLIGAFIGAGVAGWLSLRAVKNEIENENILRKAEKNEREQELINKENKAILLTVLKLEEVAYYFKNMHSNQSNQEYNLYQFKRETKIVELLSQDLKDIPDHVLSYEKYKKVQNLKLLIFYRILDFSFLIEEAENYPSTSRITPMIHIYEGNIIYNEIMGGLFKEAEKIEKVTRNFNN